MVKTGVYTYVVNKCPCSEAEFLKKIKGNVIKPFLSFEFNNGN